MRGTPFLFEGWVGGLNTVSDPYMLLPTESRECLNVVSTQRGSIRKRFGSTLFTESAGTPNVELDSLFAAVVSGVQYMLISGGGKVWVVETNGKVTEIGSGFKSGKRFSIVQAPTSTSVASQGPVYLSNGEDKPQFWNGKVEAAAVKVWKGLASAKEVSDGATTAGGKTLKSKEAHFVSSDIGLQIVFKSTPEAEGGGVVKEATIEAVNPNGEEVTLASTLANFTEKGWKEAYAALKFELKRNYYEKEEHVPNGQFMIFAGNRIWMTGIKEDPSAVWFSELVSIGEGGSQADPSLWPTSNVVRFDASDGQEITGIGTVGPYICVFKENKTWIIHDINTGANRKLSDTIGTTAHRSIVQTPQGTFFLTSEQGIYQTDGTHLHEMSYNVKPTILAANPAQRAFSAGAYFNNHYYLSFASGTEAKANRTLDYDFQLKSWWLHDLTANQWTRFEPKAGEEIQVAIPPKTKAGVVEAFKKGIYQDSEVNYTGNGTLGAFWLSHWEPFAYYIFRHRIKAPFLKKRVRQIFFNGEGEIIPSVYKDFKVAERQEPAVVGKEEISTKDKLPVVFAGPEEAKWGEGEGIWGTGEGIWGEANTVGEARIYAPGTARNWSVGFGNNSKEPFLVDAFVFMIQFRKS